MKKIITILVCGVVLLSAFSFSAFATESTTSITETTKIVETTEAAKTTEFVLKIDVNERYTNFADETEPDEVQEKENEKINDKKAVYIAILCAALVVSVVILVVALKKVPKEDDIDISGKNKSKKDKEE